MTAVCTERISVVIPAFNEAGNIGRLVDETFAALSAYALCEVIVIDDGSDDETAAEASALLHRHPRLKVLRHARRSGQSAAVRTGVRLATGELIATLDGDGQNDPADIPKLAGLLVSAGPGTALAGGVRTNRKAEGSKRLASKFANWLRDRLLNDGCPDTGCGIKVFWRPLFLDLPFFCGMHRYLPALFQSYGHDSVYAPVGDRPRLAGQSKYTNLGRALIGIYDLAGVRWIISRTRTPPIAIVARTRRNNSATVQSNPFTGTARMPVHFAAKVAAEPEEHIVWPAPFKIGGPLSPPAT